MERNSLTSYMIYLKKRLWILFMVIAIALITSGIVNTTIIQPQYHTFTTLIVGQLQGEGEVVDYSDLLLSEKLVATYGEIIKSKVILNQVIHNLGLNVPYESLRKKISVATIDDTKIIKIEVTTDNPQTASEVANEISKVFIAEIINMMRIENVQVIDPAEPPEHSLNPSLAFVMSLSSILALVVSLIIIYILKMLDNTLKTREDIEDYLELPVLGVIPKEHLRTHTFKMKGLRKIKNFRILNCFKNLRKIKKIRKLRETKIIKNLAKIKLLERLKK